MNFGGQDINVLVDTSRSNTWVTQKGFQCINATSFPVPEVNCNFGPLFDGNFPGSAIKNVTDDGVTLWHRPYAMD